MKLLMRLCFFLLLQCASVAAQDAKTAEPALVFHPLDALTGEEIAIATDVLRAKGLADDETLFASVTLLEPPKETVRSWSGDAALLPRQALAILRNKNTTAEAVVDIASKTLVSITPRPGKHPIILDRNWTRARDSFMADPRFKLALQSRGLNKDKSIMCTPNSAGWFPGESAEGKSILKIPCFSLQDRLHPSLARPIEGLMGVVDSETGEVLQVYDRQSVALPPAPAGYGKDLPKLREKMARVGFGVEGLGNLKLSGNVNVEWLNWNFHVRPDKRAGIIVSLVRFDDGKSLRDIAYQMNVSELFVPYMDPDPTWSYRTFLDAGEFGLGYLMSSLQPGIDCPDTAAYIDLTMPNDLGGSYVRDRGLCIFERPTGDPAFRHWSASRKHVEGEPQLELVVRHIPTLGNYDYVVDYVFSPQGNIKIRVGSTGFDAIKSVVSKDMDSPSAAEDTAYGSLIAPYTVAPFHDHYFNFRLDMDVDGPTNTGLRDVFVLNRTANSPRKSFWTLKSQRFLKEGAVVPDHMAMAGQNLRITNPKARNGLKQVPSLWFSAHHDAQSILQDDDPPQQRAQFSSNQFWLTRYKPQELWAAGTYPNLNPLDEGMPQFVADSEDIAEQDIVVWYTMGFRHVTRPEDFPILPTFWHEMTIRPAFFFDMDPSMTMNSGGRQ